jgi:hypothetical protein
MFDAEVLALEVLKLPIEDTEAFGELRSEAIKLMQECVLEYRKRLNPPMFIPADPGRIAAATSHMTVANYKAVERLHGS